MTLPLILTMIVRDEAATIAEVLASVRPYVQGYAIIDTGSTDGTQNVVRAAMAGVQGKLIDREWPGRFDVARSWAWDLAAEVTGGEEHWRFEVSGDSIVSGAIDLVPYHFDGPDGLWVESHMVDITWRRPKVTRSGRGWKYKGRLHEIADCPRRIPVMVDSGLRIEHRGRPPNLAEQGGRSQYMAMMLADLEEMPDDPRTVFYAAQTLEIAGRWGEARALYEQRIRMGGWEQERYVAALRVARMCSRLGMDRAGVQCLLVRAIEICPDRPEAIEEMHGLIPDDDSCRGWLFSEGRSRLE